MSMVVKKLTLGILNNMHVVDLAAPFKKGSKVMSLYAICDPVMHAKDWTTMCSFVFSQKQTIFFDW